MQNSLILAFYIAWPGNYFEGFGVVIGGFDTILGVIEV
jgi:hypothetical protein